ncbi:hypothetical protein HDU86_003457 [Geranomyces michiganensis]|nr:hypothetical protein HDU86_003457 [Geranomyces michiganensis]
MSDEFLPHQPLYGVSLSLPEITAILSTALPSATLVSATPFPPNASYNNKLYRLTAVTSADPSLPSSLILRLCGRLSSWKHNKTTNEVACLRLLSETHGVRVPKVFGWCADGEQEWILMEELPGRSLAEEMETGTVGRDDETRVAGQLASVLRVFREGMKRKDGLIGNLKSAGGDDGVVFGPFVDGTHARGYPWRSYGDYAKAMLEDAIFSLSIKPALSSNRHLVPRLQSFAESSLGDLAVLSDPTFASSVFTHGDLNARNILVHRDPSSKLLNLSGIVDFEWAGFFPLYHEFANSDGEAFDPDKDACMDKMLLDEMEKLGLETVRTVDPTLWKQARDLDSLRTNVAPWWLMEMEPDNPRLEGELRDAAKVVEEILQRLG